MVTTTRDLTPLQKAAGAVGVVFLLVGIAGFIPGLTTDTGDVEVLGHDSGAELLGLFRVNVLHNVVHLVFGLLGIAAARLPLWSRWYLLGGGATYLALWLYGLAIDLDEPANFVSLNEADNWLHLGPGLGMVALGVLVLKVAARHR